VSAFLPPSAVFVSSGLFDSTDVSDCVPGLRDRETSHTRQEDRGGDAATARAWAARGISLVLRRELEDGFGSGEAERLALLSPGERQTRVGHQFGRGQSG